MSEFQEGLRALINRHSKENGSNTPDFILAEYLTSCLEAFETATNERQGWYGINPTKISEAFAVQEKKG